jgi:hypothetical protein
MPSGAAARGRGYAQLAAALHRLGPDEPPDGLDAALRVRPAPAPPTLAAGPNRLLESAGTVRGLCGGRQAQH